MAWIKTIEPADAKGELQKIYQTIYEKRGKIANVMTAQSLNPEALKLHMDLYEIVMFGKSGLSREEREIAAVIVSAANKCNYCIVHHGEALNQYWQDEEKLLRLVEDYRSAGLSDREIALVEYANKLSLKPNRISEDDIDALRNAELSDEDILTLNLLIAYMNFANRIIAGLGVEFDPEEVQGYKY